MVGGDQKFPGAGLPQLALLLLQDTNVVDFALLENHPNLEEIIILNSPEIKNLTLLATLPKWKAVKLYETTVTGSELENLEKRQPNVTIEIDLREPQ